MSPPRLKEETKVNVQVKWFLCVCTVIRVCLLLDVHLLQVILPYEDFTAKYLHSPALNSILVNPNYTLKHLRDAHFLLQFNGNNNYGNAYNSRDVKSCMHVPPLALAMLEPLLINIHQKESYSNFIFGLALIFVDLMSSILLYQIIHCIINYRQNASDDYGKWEKQMEQQMKQVIQPERAWVFGCSQNKSDQKNSKESVNEDDHFKKYHPIIQLSDLASFSCLFYYCNPFSILSVCAMKDPSFGNILHLFILLTIQQILPYYYEEKKEYRPNISMAALYLSFVTYFELYPIVLIIPITFIITNFEKKNYKKKVMAFIGYYFAWTMALQGLSMMLVGTSNLQFVWAQTYGYQHGLKNLKPSLSTIWYMSVQLFSVFRLFYSIILTGLPFMITFPLLVRLHKQPFTLITLFIFLWIYYKSTITMPDVIFTFCLTVVSPKSLSRMGNASLVSLLAMPVPIVMYAYDYWMWLEPGSGNPNFMFFQCVAFQVFFAAFFLDFAIASVKHDKALRITEKISPGEKPE